MTSEMNIDEIKEALLGLLWTEAVSPALKQAFALGKDNNEVEYETSRTKALANIRKVIAQCLTDDVISSDCVENPFSSSCCDRGTKSCVIHHGSGKSAAFKEGLQSAAEYCSAIANGYVSDTNPKRSREAADAAKACRDFILTEKEKL
jgi:hypothetical protein